MPLLSPKIPLGVNALIFGVFSLFLLCSPEALMAQYNLTMADMTYNDRMASIGAFQQMGFGLLTAVAVQSIAICVGTEATQMNLCSMGLVSQLISEVRFYFTINTLVEEYGASQAGTYLNLCLGGVYIMLYALGAGFSIKFAPIWNMLYWGPVVLMITYIAFGLMLILATDSMFADYGDNDALGEKTVRFLVFLWGKGISSLFIENGLMLFGTLMNIDILYAYVLARAFFGIEAMGFMMSAVNNSWCLGQNDPKMDVIAQGQQFNMFVGIVLMLLFYIPLGRMDKAIAGSVEKVACGTESLLP